MQKTGLFYTVLDIKDNPKKIKLIETEITQTARSIQDVDAIISPAYYVACNREGRSQGTFSLRIRRIRIFPWVSL